MAFSEREIAVVAGDENLVSILVLVINEGVNEGDDEDKADVIVDD